MYGDAVPAPADVLVTRWHQDPLSRGAFSNYPVEVPTACFPQLAARVHRVLFAGDATSLADFDTLDGALASGRSEADKILACLADRAQCPTFDGDSLACGEEGRRGRGQAAAARASLAALLVGVAAALTLKGRLF